MEAKLLEQILTYLCDELGGEWLLTGGSLVRIDHPSLSDEAARNALFRWLIDRGLGPEWVNTAVEPFVREVPSWEQELAVLREGARGRVYRSNLTLFTYLKLRRGSEIDLTDVVKAMSACPEGLDENKLAGWATPEVAARLKKLRISLRT
jgi:hypothetical protein